MVNAQKRGTLWFLGTVFLVMSLFLSACGGGGDDTSASKDPALGTDKTTLTFNATSVDGPNPTAQTFTVTNTGAAGSSLVWSVTDDAAWLTVMPASGSLAAGASQTVTVSVDKTGLPAGISNATITVTADGLGSVPVAAQLNIAQALPILAVGSTTLTFTAPVEGGASPATQTVTVTNSGAAGTTLDWSIADNADWLSATPTSGSLAQGASQDITVTADIAGLLKGTQNAVVTVSATGLTDKTVAVQLTIGQALTVNPASLSFNVTAGNTPADQTVTLANASDLSVPWTATSDAEWLTMTLMSGTLAANGQATLPAVRLLTGSLVAGNYSGTITITPNAAVTGVTIPVTLTVNAPTAAVAKNVFIGGTVGIGQLSSLLASASVRKAAASATPTVLTDAKVTITVLKADGSKSTTFSKTNAQGAYSAQVVASAGETITVLIEKDGYTSLNKTIKVKSDDNSQYTVSGNVAQASVQVVQAAAGVFKAGGGTGPGFRFGLTRRASGALIPFAGSDQVRTAAAAGSIPELDISIPASWAPDATAITSQLAAFNPNKPAEREMFPGDFVGVGGGSVGAAKAVIDEYPLESVAFFQSKVTPNNGEPLSPTVATGASKAAAESTVIYKYIPSDGCTAVQKYTDRDDDATNGIQMPIYSYNSSTGKWIYIGEGTMKTYDYSTGAYTTVDADPSASTLDYLACGTTDYYFEIIANEWYTWWNLDYPLMFAQPEITTISGRVVNQNGAAISGAYLVADGYANGGNTYSTTYAATDGTFSLDLTLGDGKTAANYVFTAYDYSTYPALTTAFSSQVPDPTVTTGTNSVGDVVITNTLTCTVSGNISPATAWTWLDLYTDDYTFYNYVSTDASGNFTSKAPCGKPINLSTWQNSLVVNVDGFQVADTEKSDDASTVVVTDIILVNNAPEAWLWVSPNPAKIGQKISFSSSAWDYEGDYPITYTWSVKNTAGTTVKSSSLDVFSWTPTVQDTYNVSLVVTDSQGNAKTLTTSLLVNPNENAAPVIYSTYAADAQTCGGFPSFYIGAYDPDGDALSYAFSAGAPAYDAGLGGWTATAALSVPTVTVTVTDNGVPGKSATAVISVPQAAGLTVYPQVWPTTQFTYTPVSLDAYSSDPSAVYDWTVTDPSGGSKTYTGDDTFIPDQEGTWTVELVTTGGPCSDTMTNSFSVTVVPLSIAVTSKYLQYRTFEDSAKNTVRGWVQFADNGVAMNDWDFWGSSLYDANGTLVANNLGFYVNSYTSTAYSAGSFSAPTYTTESGFVFNLGTSPLPSGTYSYVTQLAGGAEIPTQLDYPAETALVPVDSTTMVPTWNSDGSLTLTWVEPADTFDNYRIMFHTAIGGDAFFYAKIPQGVESVTLPAPLIATIKTNAGMSLADFGWQLQTRLYDATNMNYARSISNSVTVSAPPGSVNVIIQ